MRIVLLLLLLFLMIIYGYALYSNVSILKNTDFITIKSINTFIFNIVVPIFNIIGYTILTVFNIYSIYLLFT